MEYPDFDTWEAMEAYARRLLRTDPRAAQEYVYSFTIYNQDGTIDADLARLRKAVNAQVPSRYSEERYLYGPL